MPLYHLCAGERSCTGLSSAAAALPPRRGAPLASCSPITCSRPSTAHPSHARAPLTVLHASSTAPSASALRVPPAGPRDNTATCCSTPSAVPVPARPASGVPASTYCPRSARYRTPAAYRAEVTAAATSSNDMSDTRHEHVICYHVLVALVWSRTRRGPPLPRLTGSRRQCHARGPAGHSQSAP
jgi:hypothetical protein